MRRLVMTFLFVVAAVAVPVALVACDDEACHDGECHENVDAMPGDGGNPDSALKR